MEERIGQKHKVKKTGNKSRTIFSESYWNCLKPLFTESTRETTDIYIYIYINTWILNDLSINLVTKLYEEIKKKLGKVIWEIAKLANKNYQNQNHVLCIH